MLWCLSHRTLTVTFFVDRQKVCFEDILRCHITAADEGFILPLFPSFLFARVIRYFVLWVCTSFESNLDVVCSLYTFSPSHALAHSSVHDLDSKRHTKTHTLCRRCGNRALHRQHKSGSPLARP